MGGSARTVLPGPQLVPKDRLDSWKEIASYLSRGERTVQRWEREEGLPVHRLTHQKQGSVFAYKEELDAWWESRRSRLETNGQTAEVKPPSRRWVVPGIVACVALLVALGAWLWPRSPSTPTSARVVPLTASPGLEIYPSLSPDGNQVAFTWNGEKLDNFDIYVKMIGPGSPVRLTTSPAEDISPAWSPDGRWIAFIRVSPEGVLDGLYVIPPVGGTERKLADIMMEYVPRTLHVPALAWTPDSRQILVGAQGPQYGKGTLASVSLETGEKRWLLAPPGKSVRDTAPTISPDGNRLAFLRCTSTSTCDVYTAWIKDDYHTVSEPKRLTFDERFANSPVWFAGGNELLYTSGSAWQGRGLYRIAASGRNGGPHRLSLAGEEVHGVSVSAKGNRMVFTHEQFDTNIWQLKLDGPGGTAGKPEKLIMSTRREFTPSLSPKGDRIVFSSDRSGSLELWVSNSDGSKPVQLTTSGDRRSLGPSWSPTGEFIAFTSSYRNDSEVRIIPAAGGPQRRVTAGGREESMPTWSRDGKFIYLLSNKVGKSTLWKVPARAETTDQPVQVAHRLAETHGFESPDGKFVYFGGSPSALWKVPVGGGEETQVAGVNLKGGMAFCRRGFYYFSASDDYRTMTLYFKTYAGGEPKRIATMPTYVYGPITASEDGRTILFAEVDDQGADLMLAEDFS
jgi:Tol biopolymer transport system component